MIKILLKSKDSEIHYALIDDKDYPIIKKYKWEYCLDRRRETGYAVAYAGQGKKVFMHKLILGNDSIGDHINGNPLDNQRHNLRKATHQQNMFNQKKPKNNTSGYKGVQADSKGFKCVVGYNKKRLVVRGKSAIECAILYDYLSISLFGEFARTNLSYTKEFVDYIAKTKKQLLALLTAGKFHYSYKGRVPLRKLFFPFTDLKIKPVKTYNYVDLANQMNITRERVRQITLKLLRKDRLQQGIHFIIKNNTKSIRITEIGRETIINRGNTQLTT